MVSAMENRNEGRRKPVTYDTVGKDKPDDPMVVAEESFGYMASCPVCTRRVFDVSDIASDSVRVRLKCPHCRNIVKIPISGITQITKT